MARRPQSRSAGRLSVPGVLGRPTREFGWILPTTRDLPHWPFFQFVAAEHEFGERQFPTIRARHFNSLTLRRDVLREFLVHRGPQRDVLLFVGGDSGHGTA